MPPPNDPSNQYRREKRKGDPQLPDKTGRYLDAIRRHVETHWGNCDNVFGEMVSAYVHLDVLIIKATAERPFHTLITSGMSDRPMSTPAGLQDQRLAELVISLPASWPMDAESWKDARNYWPIRLLKATARFPHEYASWLSRGHALPNGEPTKPYADNTDFCCVLVADPVLGGETGNTLRIDRDTTVHFLSLIPIYRDEMEFALKESPGALQDELNAAGVTELLEIGRRNVRTQSTKEYKFFCPQCGQRLSGEESWIGHEIPCPSCQAKIVVPPRSSYGSTLKVSNSGPTAESRPPVGTSSRPLPGTGGARMSPLAAASLLLALLTIPLHVAVPAYHIALGVLGFGAAIVCGHLALAQLRTDRSLTGAWMAKTGLAVGYVFVGLALILGGLYLVGQHFLHSPHPFPTVNRQPAGPPNSPSYAPARQYSPGPSVTTDTATAEIPTGPVTGTLKGQPFRLDRAQFLGGVLHLVQGRGLSIDSEVIIFLNQSAAGGIAGKQFLFPQAGNTTGFPVHYYTRTTSGAVMRNYALRLEFGPQTGNFIPGKVYLELPDNPGTKIAGTFQASVR